MHLTSKLPEIGTTIFTVMSKMAADHQAINLGQGFPDFDPDPKLINMVSEAMKNGHNQYPFMPGIEPLRDFIADKVNTLYGHQYNKDTEITITSGATQAIMAAIMAVVHAGDEVIVVEPSYDSYVPAIRLSGGIPVFVQMIPPENQDQSFRIDWNMIADAITEKTKLLILNFPHNPTGAVLTASDLDALEEIIKNTNIFLLSDEVYEHIVFEPQGHLSLSSRDSLAKRTFVISSFGKTTHTTGWKVGYCCAPANMTTEFRKVHQFMVFTVPSPFQHGLAQYTKDASTYQNLPDFYREKRDRLYEGLLKTRFKPYVCPSTFFLLADYSEISDLNEAEFSQWLTKTHGVAVIPVSAFYKDPDDPLSNHQLVRFCFAKKNETLDMALERLSSV